MSQPSFRDVEQLSAYLDGQLSKADAARLEGHLKTDPQLRSVYDDLRQARSLLGRLPARRAPRNFTLTPQMAGLKPPVPSAFPFFRLASVGAALLLVIGYAVNLSVPAAESIQTSAPMVAYGKGGGPSPIEQSSGLAPAATQAPGQDQTFAAPGSAASVSAAPASAPASAPAGAGPLVIQSNALASTPTSAASSAEPLSNQFRAQPVPERVPLTLPVPPSWLSLLLALAVASGGIALVVRARSESAWRSAHALKPARMATRDLVLLGLALLVIVLLAAGIYWMSTATFTIPLP